MTQGLGATGVMQLAGRRLLVFARFSPKLFGVVMLVAVCAFSSVASNTAVTAAFLPVATAWAAQLRIPARRILMPIAFSSMLGGTIFLFGTSTNLVVSAAMEGFGLPRIGFAELAPVGLPLAVIGIGATLLLTRWLLPAAGRGDGPAPSPRQYVAEVVLTPRSRLVGKELRQVTDGLGLAVRAVVRAGASLQPDPELVLAANDHLVTSGSLSDILHVENLRSLGLRPDVRRAAPRGDADVLVEVSLPPTSAFAGRSLADVRLAEHYGVDVVAIHRHPTLQRRHHRWNLLHSLARGDSMMTVPLSVGDLLLVSGPGPRVQQLARDADLTMLGGIDYQPPRHRRALLAVIIFAVTVVVAGLRLTSPAIAGLTGMLAMVGTGCVDTRTAFRVDWRVIILIGSVLALGLAMEKSGAGELLARGLLSLAGAIGPRGVLIAIMLVTILLSIPMSNQAAALVMLPVAIHLALDLGLAPRTFAIGTCLAASCSFMTPLEPSAALVYGPGRYRFTDFLRVGTPLTLLMLAVLAFAVPLVWPFAPAPHP
jgi:di/tricarboxylate transporter